MKTIDIFPLTIYEAVFPDYDLIKNQVMDYVIKSMPKDAYAGHEHPIRNGSITVVHDIVSNIKIQDPVMKQIHDFIYEQGKKYWEVLNFSKFLNPYVLQLWVNAVSKGGYVASHNHNPTPISGVFYINAGPQMGNLFLENPLDLVLGKSPLHADEAKPHRNFDHEVESVSGKLVLFPGWMKHFTKPNLTDEYRMSMAVNFGCFGEVKVTEFF